MPIIPMPEVPTAPQIGKPSNIVQPGGYISSELAPFVATGGGIEGQDPYALSIAGGASSRLGRHLYLAPDQAGIMAGIRRQRITDYVNQRLAEGFSQINPNRLTRKDGDFTTTIDIDWNTGEYNVNTTGGQAVSSVRSSGGVTSPLQEITNVINQQSSIINQLVSQTGQRLYSQTPTGYMVPATTSGGSPLYATSPIINNPYYPTTWTAQTKAATQPKSSVLSPTNVADKITAMVTPVTSTNIISASQARAATSKSKSGGGGISTVKVISNSVSSSASNASNISKVINANLPSSFGSKNTGFSSAGINAPKMSSFTAPVSIAPKTTYGVSKVSTPTKSPSVGDIVNSVVKSVSSFFGGK